MTQQYLERRQRNCGSADLARPQSLISSEGAAFVLGSDTFRPPFRPHALIDHARQVRLDDPPFDVTRVHLDQMGWRRQVGLYIAEPCQVLLNLADNPRSRRRSCGRRGRRCWGAAG